MEAIFFLIRFPFFLLGLPFVILWHFIFALLCTIVWLISPIVFVVIFPFKFLSAAFSNNAREFTDWVGNAVRDWTKRPLAVDAWFTLYHYEGLWNWLVNGSKL
jgi:hypothetical protein